MKRGEIAKYERICRLIFIEENVEQWYACARKRGEIAQEKHTKEPVK